VEPVSLIVGALATGVSETGKVAVKDAYEGLKRLISARFAGKPAAQTALVEHADDPDTWDKPLAMVSMDVTPSPRQATWRPGR